MDDPQRTRTVERRADAGVDTAETGESSGRGRVLSGVWRTMPTIRGFLLALGLAVAGLLLGGLVPLLGPVGRVVGVGVAAFALGLFGSRRRYVETGLAGAFAAGLAAVLGALGTGFFPVLVGYGVEIAGVGVGIGLLASLVGHYLGRDLRAGFTRGL